MATVKRRRQSLIVAKSFQLGTAMNDFISSTATTSCQMKLKNRWRAHLELSLDFSVHTHVHLVTSTYLPTYCCVFDSEMEFLRFLW
jgi:hypothetical protein